MAKLTDAEFERLITSEISAGLAFIDTDIAKRRERNSSYYQLDLRKDLPALEGQSAVTDGTMQAQIGMMLPALMRIMVGGPQIIVYEPNGLDDEAACKEATEYVNEIVFRRDNQGEDVIYKWLWDGLVQVVGVAKIYWEEDIEETDETFENLNDMQLAMLAQKVQGDSKFEITAGESETVQEEQMLPDPMTGEPVPVVVTAQRHAVTVTKRVNRSKVCFDGVPGEEFVISANARSLEAATLKSHRREMTIGALMDMGFSRDEVDSIPTAKDAQGEAQRFTRNQTGVDGDPGATDPMLREVIVHQGIVRCNKDGKGLKDWYFVAAGDEGGMTVLEYEEYDSQIVFADFCSDPIPHTFFGRCAADGLIEPTKAKTAVLRQTMQNLYLANTPITLLQADTVMKGTLEALTRRVPGGMAQVKGDPSTTVREVATPFFAQHSLPMLEYFDMESEKRTGVSRASMGLDPEVLTNQSATAANIGQTAAMGKIEMIARIFANGGMRKLGRGILKVLKRYQDFARQVKIGQQGKTIDPRKWAEFDDWDCTVQTGLGTGNRDRDLAVMNALALKAEQLLQVGGPNNGICTMGQYSQILTAMAETAGIKNPEKFFTSLPVQYTPQPSPPQPTPDALVYAQVEQQKIQEKEREAAAKIQSDERIKMAELQSKERLAVAEIQVKAQIEAAKNGLEAERIKIDYAKLGLEGVKTDVDAVFRQKEGEQKAAEAKQKKKPDAKIGVDISGLKKGFKSLEKTNGDFAKRLDGIDKAVRAPRRTKIVKGKDGSKESISEIMA